MSISSLLKNYRAENNLTQDDLAEKFGVAKMTISRIESGSQYRLSPRMVVKIASLFTKDDLVKLDPSDPQEKKILEYITTGISPAELFSPVKIEPFVVTNKVDELLLQIGFYRTEEIPFFDLGRRICRYQNTETQKTWHILFILSDVLKLRDRIYRDISEMICSALFFGENTIDNKLTIAIPNSYDAIKDQLKLHIPAYLPFDISILHFGDDGNIQQETCLRCNTDGHGIFDLDVDDTAVSAQAGKDYLAWTRAVGKIVMWEKTK